MQLSNILILLSAALGLSHALAPPNVVKLEDRELQDGALNTRGRKYPGPFLLEAVVNKKSPELS